MLDADMLLLAQFKPVSKRVSINGERQTRLFTRLTHENAVSMKTGEDIAEPCFADLITGTCYSLLGKSGSSRCFFV